MKAKTIQEVINDAKAGLPIDPDECQQVVLALSSMLSRSRMTIENIASHIGNETNIHTAARCLLGDIDYVRKERFDWLSSNARIWLQINDTNYEKKERTT